MRVLIAIWLGAAAGGAAGAALYASDGFRSALIAFFVGAVIGASLTAIVVARVVDSRPYRLRRVVPLPQATVRDHAARWFGRAPWFQARNDADELVYWRQGEPSIGLAIVFFLIGVIPGVLYLLSARKPRTIALGIFPAHDGTDLEIIADPQGSGGRRDAVRFFNSLHELDVPAVRK